jgi:hypothetical protein
LVTRADHRWPDARGRFLCAVERFRRAVFAMGTSPHNTVVSATTTAGRVAMFRERGTLAR